MSKLLVVDDEQSICWGIRRLGESIGHEVVSASSAEEGIELARRTAPDAIVLDVRLPGMDGISAMDALRSAAGPVPIVVLTAFGDLETAVRAVQHGAFDYLIKPFAVEQIERAITRAIASHISAPAVTAQFSPQHPHSMYGSSPAMQRVYKQIALAAACDASLLLLGESGTGKELAARAIHRYGPRAAGPFVAVNIAALNPSLAESELFGHVQGAFTDAGTERMGLLVRADGGTLFLDEVADIPLALQVKLLRCLEHGEVIPVGSSAPIRSTFRLISATHQDLARCVQAGSFRHDLYFRLGAFRIELPPLRERAQDIRELAECFLADAAARSGLPTVPMLADDVAAELCRRRWHGNVRELRNVVEHALLLARGGVIQLEHLPGAYAPLTPGSEESATAALAAAVQRWTQAQLNDDHSASEIYRSLLNIVEPPLFQTVLQQHAGQVASAARQLGIHRTTLKNRLQSGAAGYERE